LFRLVDIICDKMAEGGDTDTSNAQQTNQMGGGGLGGGTSARGGQNSGTTRLTNAGNNSGDNANQPCQC
jgi:hypothetical protein